MEQSQAERLQLMHQQFSEIPEGQVFSDEITLAINRLNGVSTIAEGFRLISDADISYSNLIYDAVDREGRNLRQFMENISRLRPIPSRNITFI